MEFISRPPKYQRYEAKYFITDAQAAEIRRYCRGHMPPDPHSLCRPGHQYPILSIYLDSPGAALLKSVIERHVSRFKLRVRTYRSHRRSAADSPAFFEIKRKTYGIIRKTRARVPPEIADVLLWNECGAFGGPTEGEVPSPRELNEFLQLRSRIRAKPVIGIAYTREAYERNSSDRIRITLDRDLHYGLLAPPGNGQQEIWWPAKTEGVILEVKFTNTYPFWVADMLRRVEVLRRGICKYVICSRAAASCHRGTLMPFQAQQSDAQRFWARPGLHAG